MGRPERPLDPAAGPLQQFAFDLRQLRTAAGRPSYRELSRRAHFSVTALSEAAGGEVMPSLPVTLAYVEACGGDQGVWKARWYALVAALTPSAPASEDGEPQAPYLGLATFESTDAERFFGREQVVAELCNRLVGERFLALFAPSGAGKSSLLRAGVLPTITKRDGVADPEWLVALMTPGERPLEELAVRLANLNDIPAGPLRDALTTDPSSIRLAIHQIVARRPEATCVLLVVDQFEEAFTLCRDESERAAFIDMLLSAAEEPSARVAIGVRADFYARCAAYPAFAAALTDHQVLLGQMDEDDLRKVITGPAERAGLKVEPALVEVAVGESRGQPGALPLLSHALLETWRRRPGNTLTLAGYREVGGMRGAIARTAERVYGDLTQAEQRIARDVFLRLTAFGDGTEDTRRRATPAELLGGQDAQVVSGVLAKLTAARLVTVAEDSVTVAHEALIQSWPRLQGWLAEDRELLRVHRRLTEAATEWEQHDREEDILYRGGRLAMWEGRRLDRLTDVEAAFLMASREREARERRAVRRRIGLALTGLGATTVVVSVLAGVALVQADRAADERDLAMSRQLTAEARGQLALDPGLALSLAKRAFTIRPTTDAELALRQAAADHQVRGVIPVDGGQAFGVAFSPDGRRLAATGADGTVRTWAWTGQAVTGPAVALRGHQGQVWGPAFGPDGRRLVTAGLDATVRVWPADGVGEPAVLRGHRGDVWAASFSPDGRRVASAGADGTVRVWDANGRTAPKVHRGHDGLAVGVAFSPDGSRLASASHDRTVRIWDLTGRVAPIVLRGPTDATRTVAFSPDGARVAGSSVDGTAWIWSTNGRGAPTVLRGHQGTVEGLAFSPDGRWLATSSDDNTVRVWNAGGTADPLVLRGHKNAVWAVAFSPDGSRLASASEDGTIRIWDPRGVGNPVLLRGHAGPSWAAVFTPDGRRVVSGGQDRTVRIWNLAQRGEPVVLLGHSDEVLGVTASPDGQHIATGSRDGTLRIWEADGRGRHVVLRGHDGPVWGGEFSPDGRRIATAGRDGTLRVWNATGIGEPLVRRVGSEPLRDVDFGPDGQRIATAGADGAVRIWDTTGAADPVTLSGHTGLVWSVAFSPDGHTVASAGTDGSVRLWPVGRAGDPMVLRGHEGFVWYVTFSPDGRWLVTVGKDGTVRVWPTRAAGPPVTFGGFGASVETVDFSPDGTRLVSTHDDGTVRVWHCQPCGPVETILALDEPSSIDTPASPR